MASCRSLLTMEYAKGTLRRPHWTRAVTISPTALPADKAGNRAMHAASISYHATPVEVSLQGCVKRASPCTLCGCQRQPYCNTSYMGYVGSRFDICGTAMPRGRVTTNWHILHSPNQILPNLYQTSSRSRTSWIIINAPSSRINHHI